MHMRRIPRIFYIAPAYLGQDSDLGIPAVHNKVFGICSALRSAGALPIVIAISPFKKNFGDSLIVRNRNKSTIAIQVASAGKAGVRRIVSIFSLAIAGLIIIKRKDKILLYNFFPEYILIAFFRYILGCRCYLDIEDAPRPDERGLRGSVNRWSFRILRSLCAEECVVASQNLAEYANISRFLPLYGVASWFSDKGRPQSELLTRNKVGVLFGGAVQAETGFLIFSEALRRIATYRSADKFKFYITGHFEDHIEQELLAIKRDTKLDISISRNLTNDEYNIIISQVDVGLCLKLQSNEIGKSTFPSKVIEISARGILLCSTPVSDVPIIFDQNKAVILPSEDPKDLVDALIRIEQNRQYYANIARFGQIEIVKAHSAPTVGARLVNFLSARG